MATIKTNFTKHILKNLKEVLENPKIPLEIDYEDFGRELWLACYLYGCTMQALYAALQKNQHLLEMRLLNYSLYTKPQFGRELWLACWMYSLAYHVLQERCFCGVGSEHCEWHGEYGFIVYSQQHPFSWTGEIGPEEI